MDMEKDKDRDRDTETEMEKDRDRERQTEMQRFRKKPYLLLRLSLKSHTASFHHHILFDEAVSEVHAGSGGETDSASCREW